MLNMILYIYKGVSPNHLKGLNYMTITTASSRDSINNLLTQKASTLTEPEKQVLTRFKNSFLWNAEASALTYGPDGRTSFLYQETISSPLVEALSSELIKELADAGITFEENTGTGFHKIQAVFPVVKS